MAKSSQYSTTAMQDAAAAHVAALAGGSCKLFTGSLPADGNTNPAGTLLVTHALASPAGTATNGVITFTAPANALAVASGTAGCAQLLKSDGTKYANCNVGATGGGFCLELVSTAIVAGVYVSIATLTWTEPATGA